MFNITRVADNRLDIAFSGKLDAAEMQLALDGLFKSAADIKEGLMMFRVGEYRLPTLAAIGIEFKRMPEALRFIRRFRRAAVIADQGWLKKIAELEGLLIPGLEIRGFSYGEEAQAEAWLAG